MQTHHRIIIDNAARMADIDDQSIDLVVTSPPYPMIQMWDALFCMLNPAIAEDLAEDRADGAFEHMHGQLDRVWTELGRVVKPGGVVCINIGDATRTIASLFRLFANHARIITAFHALGFTQVPTILWRKATNAPNKFMGSGMLPPGAYVTLEHEYILIFRKGGKRLFSTAEEKNLRNASAFFWEERNQWFSDVWFNLIGTPQTLHNGNGKSRERSAAFPFDLPYRLINMFSVKGDTVLDPFVGTATTMLAAMSAGRHSIGYDLDPAFQEIALQKIAGIPELANRVIERRLQAHADFIADRLQAGKEVRNFNRRYNVPVVTRQEEMLYLEPVRQIQFIGNDRFKVIHESEAAIQPASFICPPEPDPPRTRSVSKSRQLKLF
ncbi:MAG: hypothetical protein VR64_16625 [Desulfatitalea sp. BRH_c12]|nr:MAG: hypothetical protein VR64_16625 [Desulfatitalea sp. BRH_c12]